MRVSVALCTYNGAEFLQKQLQSLTLQTRLPDEIIICDDNSTDETLQILNDFKENLKLSIKIYQNNNRLGFIKNFEKAINFCTGDLVFLCDQDDIWHLNKIQKICGIFEENSAVSLVCHDMNLVTEAENSIRMSLWESLSFRYFLDNFNENRDQLLEFFLVFGNAVSGASMAFRKPENPVTFFDNEPIKFAHDFQILLQNLVENREVKFLNETLVDYRIHGNQQIGVSFHKKDFRVSRTQNYFEKKNLQTNILWLWRKILNLQNVENQNIKAKLENFGKEKLAGDIADFLSTKNLVYRFLVLTKWKMEGKYFINFRQFPQLIFCSKLRF